MNTDHTDRLNKYLALHLGVSRREADNLISSDKVLVDGEPIQLGARVDAATSIISVAGKVIKPDISHQYLMFHKPRGYVCSRKKQGESETIYTLLPKELHHLKPVGRLDRDSSGLILLTNDGDFAYRMTHPKFHKTKVYNVQLDHDLEPLHQQMISDFGIALPDGKSQLTLMRLDEERRDKWQVSMHEGRNRQIRRTFAALGYEVRRLHRLEFGNYSLGDMKSGEYSFTDIR